MHIQYRRLAARLFAVVLAVGLAAAAGTVVRAAEPDAMPVQAVFGIQSEQEAEEPVSRLPELGSQDVTVFMLVGIAMVCAAGCAALFSK